MIKRLLSQFKLREKVNPVNPVPIFLSETPNYHSSPVSPNPTIKAKVYNLEGDFIAMVTFGLSPLFDRLYIYKIDVLEKYKRKGYGISIIIYFIEKYKVPVTPIKELFSSKGFWNRCRSFNDLVTTELSVYDMQQEELRWEHLRPEKDKLRLLITQRLFEGGEAYDMAVSRGLPVK